MVCNNTNKSYLELTPNQEAQIIKAGRLLSTTHQHIVQLKNENQRGLDHHRLQTKGMGVLEWHPLHRSRRMDVKVRKPVKDMTLKSPSSNLTTLNQQAQRQELRVTCRKNNQHNTHGNQNQFQAVQSAKRKSL